MMRSRSRANTGRIGCSVSGKRRPRLARDAIAYGASARASISSSSCLVRSIAFNSQDATTPPTALEAPRSTSINMAVLRAGPWVSIIARVVEVRGIRHSGAVRRIVLAFAISALVAGCATSRPAEQPPLPPAPAPQPAATPQVVGVASWYGPGFHGHKNAAGGIYDQEDMTAASIAFPLGSRVMVTNLDNGLSVEVTITDRGPFVKGRAR